MTPYTDLLPPTKSEPHGAAFDWTPAAADVPAAGVLTVKQKRAYTSYAVCEFPAGWPGRGFHLAKLTPGTDATEESYDCFLAKAGSGHQCTCKGFQFSGGCKHIASLLALAEAGKL